METRCYGCMRQKKNKDVCEHCGYDGREPAKSHQLPPGTRLGDQYILGRVLGQGGFGITYIGWDDVMNRRVAIKEYFPTGYGGRDTRITREVTSYDNQNSDAFADGKKRFLREAEALAKLWNIPQIVGVQRYFEENGTAYIAMEYLDGQDLRRYVKSRKTPMTMEEVLDILGPIMKGLSHVHEAELVHRDISPDNIMVLPDGSVKLLDFGAARVVENASADHDRNTSTQAILKHGFAPPEQYRSRGALGPWSDIYALCATVLFCLTGKIPPESMSRMMDEAELELDDIPELSRKQKETLEKGMALKPRDRIKTAEELYSQLFGEILEERERAKQEAEDEKRRQEEERRKEEARREAERLRQEAEHSRLEETRQKEHARKEAEEKKQQEPQEDRQRKQEAQRPRKRKDAAAKEIKKPGKKWLPVCAAVLALAVGALILSGKRSAAEMPPVSEAMVDVPADHIHTVPESGVALEIAPELDWEVGSLGEATVIPVLSEYAEQIRWDTADPGVVNITEDGVLTATGYGVADVTARYGDQTAVCRVIVYPKANVDCRYEENRTGITITGYEGTMPAEAVLPRYIDGKPVTVIGRYAFADCQDVTSVFIPYGVDTLEDGVFSWCRQLNQIHIPDSVTRIEENVFLNAGWLECQTDPFVICGDGVLVAYNGTEADVTIPDTVRSICAFVFQNCTSMRSVRIPQSVEVIGREAFSRCANLTEVEIPGSVVSIGGHAFYDTPWLKAQEEEFVVVGDGVLISYNGKDSSVTVPAHVKTISSAFYYSTQLNEVTIPENVTAIDSYAFGNCYELKKVNMGSGVVRIGDHAFDTCSRLAEITIPDSVTVIGRSAFFQCYDLQKVSGGVNVKEISDFAFQACFALRSIAIGDSVERIGYMAFHMCSKLSGVSIPRNCLVSENAFENTCQVIYP